jgi:two-component system response regulator PilR (NtrC family)
MKVLVVDDELSMREYLEVLLVRAGHDVKSASSVKDATAQLGQGWDLVISDMKLGADSGLTVLRNARAVANAPEVILITAYGTPAAAVEAMRQGAYDYICKPFDNDELMLLVGKALEKREIVGENKRLKASLMLGGRPFHAGESPVMKELWSLIDRVAAASRSTVLISGESGTGKEVVARAIHLRSVRAAHPFMPINCGAIAEGVLESELFGHVKGSYTGATGDRPGILVAAGGGTVLLDEIGELPLAMQVKLLRVLQERKVKPVGASTEVPFDARIVAATNRKLAEEVRAGRFREDLYHRLNVIAVEVPPLRERREDIRPLAQFFLSRFREELDRPALYFAPETLDALERFPFPGNVRQLENLVERAATLSTTDALLPTSMPPAVSGESEPAGEKNVQLTPGFSLERHLDADERQHLLEALRQADGVKTRAAELLGLSFRSFRYRLAKHGLGSSEG